MSNQKRIASTDYKELKLQAVEMGIADAHKINKKALTELVQNAFNALPVDETVYEKPGRPVNPNSARQQRLADLEARRAAGTLKLGRPAETDSERQKRIAEKQAKVDAYNAQQVEIANGAVIDEADVLPNPASLGRPVNPESPRQKAIREYEAKKAAGLIKKGRPSFAEQGKMTKEQEAKLQKTVVITDAAPADVVTEDVTVETEA